MRASVICVTNRPRGLDLPVNGLLGQVEPAGWEPRQVVRNGKLTIEPNGKPIYRQLKGFELVVVDTSVGGAVRDAEVAAASRLAPGNETNRVMLTKYEFVYRALPGGTYWEGLLEAFKWVRGENVVVVVPDMSYPGPRFVSAHLTRGESLEVTVGSVETREYTKVDEHTIASMGWVGMLVDPWTKTVSKATDGHHGFTPQALGEVFEAMRTHRLEPPAGHEFAALVSVAERLGGAVKRSDDEGTTLLRLRPFECVEPEPRVEALAEFRSRLDDKLPPPAKPQPREHQVRRIAWWPRIFG